MHQFVVCGRNIPLGIYPDRYAAVESIRMSVQVLEPVFETEDHSQFDTERGRFVVQKLLVSEYEGPLFVDEDVAAVGL